jgi:amidohydrolase
MAAINALISATVADDRAAVEPIARRIHAEPEIAFEEHRAATALCDLFENRGGVVRRAVGGLPTAFTATFGTGALTVGVCLEYDALPGIGHGCGHNLIAGAGALTTLALARVADDLGITVRAIGCPAEEHGGGKVPLLDAGVFDGCDLAVMVHMVPDGIRPDPAGTSSQAVGRYRATFTGQAAHAAASPHLGVNAADAVVVSQVAIGLLRQQIPGDHRVSANVVRVGDVTNIIPDRATVEFECRAFTIEAYEALLPRVSACFEAGALATGCSVSITSEEPVYEPLLQDDALAAHWAAALRDLGVDPEVGIPLPGGSTDMGNVSRRIRSLHPWFPLVGVAGPIHSGTFTEAAGRDEAYDAMAVAAQALARTVAAEVLSGRP